jgi:flagellar biosynthesis/type III secretory pathway chaperone
VRLYRLGEEHDLAAIDDRLRGNYLLYGSRLYELKHPPWQYTPKRYRPKDGCAGKGVLQIFFEVFFGESQMHRLYLYYCYQLGILPKKQHPCINRPELERIWKDTEKILAEHAFVHDHKFPSLQAIVDYRKGLSRQMEALAAQRAEIVKQMRRKDASPELEAIWKNIDRVLAEHAFVHDHKFPSLQAIVDYRKSLSQQMETLAAQRAEIVKQMRRKDAPSELADRRAMLTCKIAELRKEDKIAEGAIKRIQRTRESNRIDRENRMPLHPRPRRRRREQERE